MKNLLFVFLIVFIGTMSFAQSDLSFQQRQFKSSLPEQFIIESDPDNPYQGTWLWLEKASIFGDAIVVIEGTTATLYSARMELLGKRWRGGETFFHNIDTSPEWVLSEDKNTLQRMEITYNSDNSVRSSRTYRTYVRY
jgi:hypothetical protein